MALSFDYFKLNAKYMEVKRFQPKLEFDVFFKRFIRDITERQSDTVYYTNERGEEQIFKPVNHFPQLKEYEVWMEGYAATGEHDPAVLIGKVHARNFAQACHMLFAQSFLENAQRENSPDFHEYCTPGRWDYNGDNLSFWGRRLFDNEKEARESFG